MIVLAAVPLAAVLVAALLAAVLIAALLLAVAVIAAAARVLLRPVMFGGPLGRMRVGTAVRDVELDLDQLLDVAQERPFFIVAKRDRDAFGPGARGAADAMHIAFRNVRQVVIDDVADAIHVDAARRDVGRDQGLELAGAARAEHALALVLRFVAVDRLG